MGLASGCTLLGYRISSLSSNECVEVPFGCAMFKGKRFVREVPVTKGYLSSKGMFGAGKANGGGAG